MLTIKEIKEIIDSIDDIDDMRLKEFSQDPRKGVAKLVENKHKSIMKLSELKEKHRKRQRIEKKLKIRNFTRIAGIDEVGRGPLAGPVVAAIVILPDNTDKLLGVTDSKRLSRQARIDYNLIIKEIALEYAYGVVTNQEIDQLNIYQATKLAMQRAVDQVSLKPDYLLIDAMTIDTRISQQSIIKGDQKSLSIAAASILAKEFRDDLMLEYHDMYPEFSFNQNVGYGTKDHLRALELYGYTPIHRTTFEPVKSMSKKYNL